MPRSVAEASDAPRKAAAIEHAAGVECRFDSLVELPRWVRRAPDVDSAAHRYRRGLDYGLLPCGLRQACKPLLIWREAIKQQGRSPDVANAVQARLVFAGSATAQLPRQLAGKGVEADSETCSETLVEIGQAVPE